MTKSTNEIDEQGAVLCKAGIECQNSIVSTPVPFLFLSLASVIETKTSENTVLKTTDNPFIVH